MTHTKQLMSWYDEISRAYFDKAIKDVPYGDVSKVYNTNSELHLKPLQILKKTRNNKQKIHHHAFYENCFTLDIFQEWKLAY